jgi:hypothetical protein
MKSKTTSESGSMAAGGEEGLVAMPESPMGVGGGNELATYSTAR